MKRVLSLCCALALLLALASWRQPGAGALRLSRAGPTSAVHPHAGEQPHP